MILDKIETWEIKLSSTCNVWEWYFVENSEPLPSIQHFVENKIKLQWHPTNAVRNYELSLRAQWDNVTRMIDVAVILDTISRTKCLGASKDYEKFIDVVI